MKNKFLEILKNNSNLILISLYLIAVLIGFYQISKENDGKKEKNISSLVKKFGTKETQVAVIPIYGFISIPESGPLSQSASADEIVRKLKNLSEKEEVKAVILRINSPGGSVAAVQEIYDEVIKLKKSGKIVVASMGDVAASGGYYIASAADKIFANPSSITGSIGVIFETGNVQELFKKIGVKMEAIKSREHKDIGSPFRPMSEKERGIIQSIIDDAYAQFVDVVISGRKLSKEKALLLSDGRIYSGSQAKTEGLVDELGNIEAAISKAAEMAGIKGKPKVYYEEDRFGKFLSVFSQESHLKLWQIPATATGVRLAYVWEYFIP